MRLDVDFTGDIHEVSFFVKVGEIETNLSTIVRISRYKRDFEAKKFSGSL